MVETLESKNVDLREKVLALALVRHNDRRHTNSAREVNKLFCTKIAMHKLDLSNSAICVVKLDSVKLNYFVACSALGKHIHH